jgi:hypothetical protein
MAHKRLFQITDRTTRTVVPGLYFADKPTAKQKRRELNDGDESKQSPNSLRYIVSPGPDHHHYAGR